MNFKDITSERFDVVSLMKQTNDFKSIKIYQFKDNMIIKTLTPDDKIQISASTSYGPSSENDILEIFNKITTKNINRFTKFMSGSSIYFVEDNSLN